MSSAGEAKGQGQHEGQHSRHALAVYLTSGTPLTPLQLQAVLKEVQSVLRLLQRPVTHRLCHGLREEWSTILSTTAEKRRQQLQQSHSGSGSGSGQGLLSMLLLRRASGVQPRSPGPSGGTAGDWPAVEALVAHGGFGSVFKGLWQGLEVAIK
ncbi:hypothetical protein HaLaN_14482, partial [Haematococcus lacustris]